MMTLRKSVKITLTTIVLLSVFLMPMISFAQMGQLDDVAQKSGLKGDASLMDIIANIINTILGLVGIILLILFIYAGFLWMTAGGDSDQIKKAKDILKNAVIGVIIIVLSYAISNYVISRVVSLSDNEVQETEE